MDSDMVNNTETMWLFYKHLLLKPHIALRGGTLMTPDKAFNQLLLPWFMGCGQSESRLCSSFSRDFLVQNYSVTFST